MYTPSRYAHSPVLPIGWHPRADVIGFPIISEIGDAFVAVGKAAVGAFRAIPGGDWVADAIANGAEWIGDVAKTPAGFWILTVISAGLAGGAAALGTLAPAAVAIAFALPGMIAGDNFTHAFTKELLSRCKQLALLIADTALNIAGEQAKELAKDAVKEAGLIIAREFMDQVQTLLKSAEFKALMDFVKAKGLDLTQDALKQEGLSAEDIARKFKMRTDAAAAAINGYLRKQIYDLHTYSTVNGEPVNSTRVVPLLQLPQPPGTDDLVYAMQAELDRAAVRSQNKALQPAAINGMADFSTLQAGTIARALAQLPVAADLTSFPVVFDPALIEALHYFNHENVWQAPIIRNIPLAVAVVALQRQMQNAQAAGDLAAASSVMSLMRQTGAPFGPNYVPSKRSTADQGLASIVAIYQNAHGIKANPNIDATLQANQILLQQAGFYTGTPNGQADGIYVGATKAFQASRALAPTGNFDPVTYAALLDTLQKKAPLPVLPGTTASANGGGGFIQLTPEKTGNHLGLVGTTLTAIAVTAPAWGAYLYARYKGLR